MGKPRFYDTSNIKFKIGNVVERTSGEGVRGIFTVTGVKAEKWDNGLVHYSYQLNENDKDWVPAGYIRLFTDPNTVNNIVSWLDDNLSDYVSIQDGEAAWATDLLNDLRNNFIPENEEE